MTDEPNRLDRSRYVSSAAVIDTLSVYALYTRKHLSGIEFCQTALKAVSEDNGRRKRSSQERSPLTSMR